jgi:hypothetical protein
MRTSIPYPPISTPRESTAMHSNFQLWLGTLANLILPWSHVVNGAKKDKCTTSFSISSSPPKFEVTPSDLSRSSPNKFHKVDLVQSEDITHFCRCKRNETRNRKIGLFHTRRHHMMWFLMWQYHVQRCAILYYGARSMRLEPLFCGL